MIRKISILLPDFDHHNSDTFSQVTILIKFGLFYVQNLHASSLLSNAFVQYHQGFEIHFILESKSVKYNRYSSNVFVRISGQEGIFCVKILLKCSFIDFWQKSILMLSIVWSSGLPNEKSHYYFEGIYPTKRAKKVNGMKIEIIGGAVPSRAQWR